MTWVLNPMVDRVTKPWRMLGLDYKPHASATSEQTTWTSSERRTQLPPNYLNFFSSLQIPYFVPFRKEWLPLSHVSMATITNPRSFWHTHLPLFTRYEIFMNEFRVETARLTRVVFADAADAERLGHPFSLRLSSWPFPKPAKAARAASFTSTVRERRRICRSANKVQFCMGKLGVFIQVYGITADALRVWSNQICDKNNKKEYVSSRIFSARPQNEEENASTT